MKEILIIMAHVLSGGLVIFLFLMNLWRKYQADDLKEIIKLCESRIEELEKEREDWKKLYYQQKEVYEKSYAELFKHYQKVGDWNNNKKNPLDPPYEVTGDTTTDRATSNYYY